jgi:hypothetical protein
LKLGIGCIHIHGDLASPLPPQPFKGLRIVFTDLYLSAGSLGRTAAAHTANVFKTVVSADTAPVLVVIWSKHTTERGDDESNLPPDDQPTAATLFKDALLEAQPLFRGRLIFTEMAKPKPRDRPEDTEWIINLQSGIKTKFEEFPACDVLWAWESLVRNAGISISEEITAVALQLGAIAASAGKVSPSLDENIKVVFRQLTKEQGGPDCSSSSASRHLAAVLAQLIVDQVEHSDSLEALHEHGAWLCEQEGLEYPVPFASQLNGMLLTAAISGSGRPFVPGTIYRINDVNKFEDFFSLTSDDFIASFYKEAKKSWTSDEWKSQVTLVAIEISPACDFHKGMRRQAFLIAGLMVPAAGRQNAKRADSFEPLPTFNLRWPINGKHESDVFLTFCCRYKLTMNHTKEPEWLVPWFRLRELPTASLRNWHASHSARVGYVALR